MSTPTDREREFATLDLDELETAPLRPAVYVAVIAHGDLPSILAAGLPSVVHACREMGPGYELHEFVDTDTGAAVRYLLYHDEHGHTRAHVAESGLRNLWDRIVLTCDDWERTG